LFFSHNHKIRFGERSSFTFIKQHSTQSTASNIAFAKCGQTMELQQQQHCKFGLGLDR
jgi:hypothetical protein